MPALTKVLVAGERVYLRRPVLRDAGAFLTAVKASLSLHGTWVQAPTTRARFIDYVRHFSGARSRDARTASHVGLVVCRREDDALAGVFNFSEIVRGALQ